MKIIVTILLVAGIFLQPCSKMLAFHFLQSNHIFQSSEKGIDGQLLTFCGSDTAVQKKIRKEENQKDHGSSSQEHAPVFQLAAHQTCTLNFAICLDALVHTSRVLFLIPSQYNKGIFQPPQVLS